MARAKLAAEVVALFLGSPTWRGSPRDSRRSKKQAFVNRRMRHAVIINERDIPRTSIDTSGGVMNDRVVRVSVAERVYLRQTVMNFKNIISIIKGDGPPFR